MRIRVRVRAHALAEIRSSRFLRAPPSEREINLEGGEEEYEIPFEDSPFGRG